MIQRLRNREEAGQVLAKLLQEYEANPNCIVMALPRGGVVTAYEIAHALRLPLDVCVVRKLGVPTQPEVAMGAIAFGGVIVLNHDVIHQLSIPQEEIEAVAQYEGIELKRREKAYRGDRPHPICDGQTVILVDDGIATGSTMEAAIAALRRSGASKIVVAVAVAPPKVAQRIAQLADRLICVMEPLYLSSVSDFYEEFEQVSDEIVKELLQKAAALSPH